MLQLEQIFALLEQIFAVICSKPIFGASASEQILSSAEHEICSNATVGQPCKKMWKYSRKISGAKFLMKGRIYCKLLYTDLVTA